MVEKEYIERGSALFELETGWFPQSMEYTEAVEIARNIIRTLPAAAVVEVKRGRWVDRIMVGREHLWFCSECDTMGSPQWKCCPVCTAFMDRKGESDGKTG